MKKTRILVALTVTIACLGIISMVTVSAVNPETAAYCPAPSENSMLNGNVASANGSGHNGSLTLSFGAFDHGEGNVTGQATFINDAAKTKITIDVEGLSVSGNSATVGGTVQRSNDLCFALGSYVTFDVVDNGEGAGAIPDTFTSPSPTGMCMVSPQPGPIPNDTGNIQVRFVAPGQDCTMCPVGTHCAGNGECVGGGGSACKIGYVDCCGRCILKELACPGCVESPE